MTFKFLAGISSLVLLFPLTVSILKYNKLTTPLKVIALHIFVAAAFELVSRFLWIYKQNNLFLLHLYTFWELEIISCFYLLLLRQHVKRFGIIVIMVLFALFSWADAFYMDGLTNFNTYARPVECIILMSYAIIYLYGKMTDAVIISLKANPELLIHIAFLCYFSISFFLFLLSNSIMKDTGKAHAIWAMHTLTALFFYTTIGIALWKAGKT